MVSLPSWERGLKFLAMVHLIIILPVAPLVGARIEIYALSELMAKNEVAPLVGARIEICSTTYR